MLNFVKVNREKVDLIEYCIKQRMNYPDLKVHVGCDSIVVGGNSWFVTVIAFRYGKNGAHFIFNKTRMSPFRMDNGKPDIFRRLLQETKFTMDLAEFLTSNSIFNKTELILEFDFNNMKETRSREHVAIAQGWASGFGYTSYLKSDMQIACKAANQICQSC